ncbi:ubiquitin thioesterase OTU1-like [Stegodyphus dumicola]|uniref:ubiquitin thioesterase OTU1-like n=1 Tax=Stegodyphus dumicola TaxID=202533 RepID=UPI0015B1DE5E|nr:ubiquitin thioesterase OTU1-like [Stegodyphus dumicola]XP_035205497.1 ubiquitin thioesterase OTU1-like [Stegodyphus dumicola]
MAMSKLLKSESVHDEGKTRRFNKIRPSCDRFFTSRNFFGAQINHETETGMMSCRVPEDNSLLTSIYFILSDGLILNGETLEIRKMIAEEVTNNPERYTTAFLGMPAEDFCQWVMIANHGQGALELAILSEHLQIEIIVIDCFTLAATHYGESENYTDRFFLIYDAGHYDPLLYEQNDIWWTIFPASDEAFLQMALEAAQKAKINLTLYCPVCNALLHGNKAARAHVMATGHKEFEELAV